MDNIRQQVEHLLLPSVNSTDIIIGSGAYGSVEAVVIPGAICAAKRIHHLLEASANASELSYAVSRFVNECLLMSALRHPNIVQFLGLYYFPRDRLPALIMERMLTSLHDLLEPENPSPAPLEPQEQFIPLGIKCSMLKDVACGLLFLHAQSPPIIHRDLTAKNVLLNSAMVAKVADLGVARFLPRMSGAASLTKVPGAPVYMPPETTESKSGGEREQSTSEYDSKVDIFSFGVVAIFTLCQTFPCNLLNASYHNEKRNKLKARTELERREEYMKKIHQYEQLHHQHPLLQMIHQCLENSPEKRPDINQVLLLIDQARANIRDEHAGLNKLELVQALQKNQGLKGNFMSQVQELQQQLDSKTQELDTLQQRIHECQQKEAELVEDHHSPSQKVRKKKPKRTLSRSSAGLVPRQLSLPGNSPPQSIPFIISSQDHWNPSTCQLEVGTHASNNCSFKLTEDALELLRSIEKPLAVVSICGQQLSGKSYFLSRLLGSPEAFKLGRSMQPCTRGIWMATTILECPEFATIFLDIEGYDPSLAPDSMVTAFLTLATLLSSFLIFNSKVFHKVQCRDLEFAKPLTQVSTALLALCNKSMSCNAMKSFFPQFLWLFRDVNPKQLNRDMELGDFLSAHLPPESGDVVDLSKTLVSLFPSPKCATLPVPTINKRDLQDMVHHQERLKQVFNTAVDALIESILSQVSPKRATDGTTMVSGRVLSVLASSYIESMKKSTVVVPDPARIWQNMVRQQLIEYSKRLVVEYREEMTSLVLPRNLSRIHEHFLSQKRGLLREKIRAIDPLHSSDNDAKPLLDKLEKEIIGLSHDSECPQQKKQTRCSMCLLREENCTASKKFCEELFVELVTAKEIEEKVDSALNDSEPLDIQADIDEIRGEYEKRAVGPAAGEVLESRLSNLAQLGETLRFIPGKPQEMKVARSGSNQMKLSWKPPLQNPEAVEEYVVHARPKEGQWEEVARTRTLSALVGGSAACEYQVTAINSQIQSIPSHSMQPPTQCIIS